MRPHDPPGPRPPRSRLPPTPLPDLLQRLYLEGFTGQLVFHCVEGYPREVEISGRRYRISDPGAVPDSRSRLTHPR